LEIYERLRHPPLQVNTLAQLGVLYKRQSKFDEAVSYFGKAFIIATNFEMSIRIKILVNLNQTMKLMRKEAFRKSWGKYFDEQDAPFELLDSVLKEIESDD
jgi:hypothetical protein